MIIMVVKEFSEKPVSPSVILATEVFGHEPDIMRQAIIPEFESKSTQTLGSRTAHMVHITDSRNIVTMNE